MGSKIRLWIVVMVLVSGMGISPAIGAEYFHGYFNWFLFLGYGISTAVCGLFIFFGGKKG